MTQSRTIIELLEPNMVQPYQIPGLTSVTGYGDTPTERKKAEAAIRKQESDDLIADLVRLDEIDRLPPRLPLEAALALRESLEEKFITPDAIVLHPDTLRRLMTKASYNDPGAPPNTPPSFLGIEIIVSGGVPPDVIIGGDFRRAYYYVTSTRSTRYDPLTQSMMHYKFSAARLRMPELLRRIDLKEKTK